VQKLSIFQLKVLLISADNIDNENLQVYYVHEYILNFTEQPADVCHPESGTADAV